VEASDFVKEFYQSLDSTIAHSFAAMISASWRANLQYSFMLLVNRSLFQPFLLFFVLNTFDVTLCVIILQACGFGGLEMSVLAFGTQVRGFKPGRSRRIFRAKKSSARLPSEGK